MAINKKLIHFNRKEVFEEKLANNEILDTSIVFIKDSKEIWTHGTYFGGCDIVGNTTDAHFENLCNFKNGYLNYHYALINYNNDVYFGRLIDVIESDGYDALRMFYSKGYDEITYKTDGIHILSFSLEREDGFCQNMEYIDNTPESASIEEIDALFIEETPEIPENESTSE